MKKTTKALALALCAVLLVVGTALTTVAYLTSKDNVVNTFTVGKVNIKLDETDVDEYGKEDGDTRVKANEYKLVPACTYIKDPTVHVEKGSEPCYVRMILTVDNIASLKAGIVDNTVKVDNYDVFLLENLCKDEEGNSTWNKAWEMINYKEEGTKGIYEFRYNTVVDAREETNEYKDLPALFEKFTLPKTVTEKVIGNLDAVQINVEAHAIQSAGFKTATEAWTAFDAQIATYPAE